MSNFDDIYDHFHSHSFSGIDDILEATSGKNISEQIREMARNIGYVTSKDDAFNLLRNFNITTRPYLETDNGAGLYRSFVYFIRPDLNLFSSNEDGTDISLHPQVSNYPELYSLMMSDPVLFSELSRSGCKKSNLFHLLSNHCIEVSPPRPNENNREGVKNMYGHNMPSIGNSDKNGLEISCTFADTNSGDIAKLFYAWREYINHVTVLGLSMDPQYIMYKALDYPTSIYIITTDTHMNIVNFAVGIDLQFSDIPTHLAQHKIDGFTKNELMENFTINFKCRSFYSHGPQYFDVFNAITGFDPKRLVDMRGSEIRLMKNFNTIFSNDSETVNSSRDLILSPSGGVIGNNSVKTLGGVTSYNDLIETENTYDNSGVHFPNKGIYEMLVGAPGIYGVYNNKLNRMMFKLGFTQIE